MGEPKFKFGGIVDYQTGIYSVSWDSPLDGVAVGDEITVDYYTGESSAVDQLGDLGVSADERKKRVATRKKLGLSTPE